MKKLLSVVLTSILMLSLVGCSSAHDDDQQQTGDAAPNRWGVTLVTEQVTETGLTLACHHSGGEDVVELNTGSYYVVQQLKDGLWVDVEFAPQKYDIAWTMEAWMIPKEDTISWDVNWEWLYCKLPAGEYRIGKEIMNFRGTGDYDVEMVYAEFVIE